jgi:hypothetical protein
MHEKIKIKYNKDTPHWMVPDAEVAKHNFWEVAVLLKNQVK